MGQFDQTARPLAKTEGAHFFGWTLTCCLPQPGLTFLAWDDTRRLVRPGESDRTNDLVALFHDDAHPGRQTWVVAEIEEEPEPGIFYRMGQYELLLGREVNPSCNPGGPAVGSLVLNLTGVQKEPRLEWAWGTFGTRLAPFVVDVGSQDALSTLGRIERGELGLTVLPFLALMDGGGTTEFIDRWKRVVEAEPDSTRQMLYRDSALVFADLTPRAVNWLRGMEGRMMRESPIIKGWMREGEQRAELRTKREDLLKAVKVRLENPVPETIRLAVEGTNDLSKLELWYDTALTAETIHELRKEMKLEP